MFEFSCTVFEFCTYSVLPQQRKMCFLSDNIIHEKYCLLFNEA